jgi:hypothetical protein
MSSAVWLVLDLVAALLLVALVLQRRGQVFTLLRFRRMPGDDAGPPLTHRPRWLSTQPPPNPDAIPRLLAQRMGPFPMTPHGGDWNFFCYVHIAPGRPVTIRGRRVPCRHANLTLYFPEHLRGEASALPPSLDAAQIHYADDGSYELVIGHEPTDAANALDPAGHRHGMLALRHYVFEDGVDLHYPEIRWGDQLVLPARTLVGLRSAFPRRGPLRRRA